MHIHEAVEEDEKIDGYITGGFSDDSEEYFLKYDYNNRTYYQLQAEAIGIYWRPVPEELITNKWRVVTKDEFLETAKVNKIKIDREWKEWQARKAHKSEYTPPLWPLLISAGTAILALIFALCNLIRK